MLLRATAPGNSARGTMSPTDACHAGALNAAPQPIRKVNSSNNHGVIHPDPAHTDRTTDTTSMKICAPSMILRRSKLSAIAPAASENSMTGSATEACTSATMPADCAIEIISQDAPTDWIMPPRLDEPLAIQTLRKIGYCIADSAERRCGASGGVGAICAIGELGCVGQWDERV